MQPKPLPFTYFISDLHLSEQRPDITECFNQFMLNEATQAEALYILGDLFELWLGDDDITDFSIQIADIIKQVSEHIPVFFIHGNRDFAIGNEYADKCGMQILDEQTIIDLYGEQVLILHGDEMCTRDIEYMKFRKKARGWWWPKLMRALPLALRRRIAQKGRKVSKENQQRLSAEIMDVSPEEVATTLLKHGVSAMIHGHTHRPKVHHFNVNEEACQRIVLGDWYDQGSILKVDSTQRVLIQRPFS